MRARNILQTCLGLMTLTAAIASGQTTPQTLDSASSDRPNSNLSQVVVVGTAPVPGANIDADKVPGRRHLFLLPPELFRLTLPGAMPPRGEP